MRPTGPGCWPCWMAMTDDRGTVHGDRAARASSLQVPRARAAGHPRSRDDRRQCRQRRRRDLDLRQRRFPIWLVSEFASLRAAMEIFGVSRFISVPIPAVFVWALTVLGSYSRAERLFLILALAFLAYPIAAFLGHPHGHEVLTNLVSPHFPASHAFLVLAVALIGTTITPYMQFYDASAVVDKHITPANYPSERIDSVSGSIWSNIVSIFIIIATAAAIGGSGPLQSAPQAAEALRAPVGPAAPALLAAGLLGAALLAASVGPLSTSYAIADAIGAPRSVSASL